MKSNTDHAALIILITSIALFLAVNPTIMFAVQLITWSEQWITG